MHRTAPESSGKKEGGSARSIRGSIKRPGLSETNTHALTRSHSPANFCTRDTTKNHFSVADVLIFFPPTLARSSSSISLEKPSHLTHTMSRPAVTKPKRCTRNNNRRNKRRGAADIGLSEGNSRSPSFQLVRRMGSGGPSDRRRCLHFPPTPAGERESG